MAARYYTTSYLLPPKGARYNVAKYYVMAGNQWAQAVGGEGGHYLGAVTIPIAAFIGEGIRALVPVAVAPPPPPPPPPPP